VLLKYDRPEKKMNFTTTSPTTAFSLDADYRQYKERCVVMRIEFDVIVRFPSDGFLLNHKFLFGFCTALTVAIVLMNSATVLTFWRSTKLKNRISYFLIMLQSFFDTLVGLFNASFFTHKIASEIQGNVNCHLVFVYSQVAEVFMGFSLTSLFLINLERYIGVVHPLVHKGNWNKKRILKYGIYHLLLWQTFLGLLFLNPMASRYCINVHLLAYCVLTAYIYIRIYRKAVAKPFPLQTAPRSTWPRRTDSSHDSEIPSTRQRVVSLANRQRHLKETKLARSCFLVVACFFACYMPVGVAFGLKMRGFLGDAVKQWALAFAISNSLWNSLIFVWRDRVLRSEMKKVMSKYFSA
jgi:hypothetical protein